MYRNHRREGYFNFYINIINYERNTCMMLETQEKTGYDLLNDPFLNKGTAFTQEEREKYGLVGILPPVVQSLDQQVQQVYLNLSQKDDLREKRHYLMNIFSRNRTLFFAVFSKHLKELMPIVYDPGVADSVKNYSNYLITPQNAAFLRIDQKEQIKDTLINSARGRDIELIVVTDSEAILGIGDWGTNGVSIAVGKLMVYTAAAGIDPKKVLPVVIDAGTSRESLINDPLYLGLHKKRVKGQEYYDFVDQFVETAESLFPHLYLHFEDFGRDNAANLLEKYKHKYAVFNDDIEGTGIVTLAGILGGLNISGEKLQDQKYMCFGAGTAGCGIVKRIYTELLDQGMSEQEAKSHFYLVDKQGILFDDMDDLTLEQRPFARKRSEFGNGVETKTLLDAIKAVHPTILVGTSTVPGAFTKEVVEEMHKFAKHPIIFPLSNPTELAEAKAKDLIEWTNGMALVATGIPTEPVLYNGTYYEIGQANNALVYPGLGLGVMTSEAKLVTETMISSAAHAIGGLVDPTEKGAAVLPPIQEIVSFSKKIAEAVCKEARIDKVAQGDMAREDFSDEDIKKAIADNMWQAEYK